MQASDEAVAERAPRYRDLSKVKQFQHTGGKCLVNELPLNCNVASRPVNSRGYLTFAPICVDTSPILPNLLEMICTSTFGEESKQNQQTANAHLLCFKGCPAKSDCLTIDKALRW